MITEYDINHGSSDFEQEIEFTADVNDRISYDSPIKKKLVPHVQRGRFQL